MSHERGGRPAAVFEEFGAPARAYRGGMRVDEATRFIAAAPDRVLAAFADAELLQTWLPPTGMTGRIERADLRAGGSFRTVLVYRDGGGARGKTSEDTDVSDTRVLALEPGRVVWAVDFDSDEPRLAGTMTITWSIEAQASGSLVTVRATDVPEGIDSDDHLQGLTASLDNLAHLVAED